jgi:hypothetical protein
MSSVCRGARRRSSANGSHRRCRSRRRSNGSEEPRDRTRCATASATAAVVSSRPEHDPLPSRCRTVHTHRSSPGHAPEHGPTASEIIDVLTVPSGISPESSAHGGAENGRAAARRSARTRRRRGGAAHRGAVPAAVAADRLPSSGVSLRATTACPARVRGGRLRPDRRAASQPRRSRPTFPTMTSALRGSHPVTSCSAASTPAWKAPPTTPPAPSTIPTRGASSFTTRHGTGHRPRAWGQQFPS